MRASMDIPCDKLDMGRTSVCATIRQGRSVLPWASAFCMCHCAPLGWKRTSTFGISPPWPLCAKYALPWQISAYMEGRMLKDPRARGPAYTWRLSLLDRSIHPFGPKPHGGTIVCASADAMSPNALPWTCAACANGRPCALPRPCGGRRVPWALAMDKLSLLSSCRWDRGVAHSWRTRGQNGQLNGASTRFHGYAGGAHVHGTRCVHWTLT